MDDLWTAIPYFGMLAPCDSPAEWVKACFPTLLFLRVSVPVACSVTHCDASFESDELVEPIQWTSPVQSILVGKALCVLVRVYKNPRLRECFSWYQVQTLGCCVETSGVFFSPSCPDLCRTSAQPCLRL